ncbi:hypothetical protein GCM10022263_13280 [Nocardioides daeguensis]|uniref:Uncharacterized protein n=1 Tax=Nocardioides daeguensis TaxID=908359 RepID=A0ABP6UZH3_9ACTN
MVAVPAGAAQPRDRDPVPDGTLGDAGTDGGDDADALVAGDEGRSRLDGPVAVGGVDVGVAQAARLHPYDDLPGARLGQGALLDDERGVEAGHDCCFHGCSPGVRSAGGWQAPTRLRKCTLARPGRTASHSTVRTEAPGGA